MKGQRWNELIEALNNSVRQIGSNNKNNKISVVNFSTDVKVEAENYEPSMVIPKEFIFQGCLSHFENSLMETINIINRCGDKMKYHIIFMSDGELEYPTYSIEELKKLRKKFTEKIDFDCIQFHSNSEMLKKVSKELNSEPPVNAMNFKTLDKAYCEIINKDLVDF